MRNILKTVSFGLCITVPGIAAASVAGSNIPAEKLIIDSGSNVWTLNNGVVYENGHLAGYSRSVVTLLYSNGLIYQENQAGGWWSWTGSYWTDSANPHTASANGTAVPGVAEIIDSKANIWSVAGGVVYMNGVAAGYTAKVKQLLYVGGTVYQENTSSNWWSWTNGAWVAHADPRNATITATSAIKRIEDASSNVWTLVSGVVYKNGGLAGYSAKVTQLLYYNGVIYQENAAGGFWSWNGGGWTAASNPQTSTQTASTLPTTTTPVTKAATTPSTTAAAQSGTTTTTAATTTPKAVTTAGAVTTAPKATTTTTTTVASTASGYPSYSGKFGVQVAGNKLVSTQTGSVVPVVGANVSGLEQGMSYTWPLFSNATSASWALVKNWGHGVNTVRLPLNEATWLNYQCEDPGTGVGGRYTYIGQTASGHGLYQPDPTGTYKQAVINAVANATAAGLYVILDLHWGAPNGTDGVAICPIGQPGFADADHSIAFWKSVADTFKNNPAVIFELFNEPYGDNDFNNFVTSVNGGNNNQIGPEATLMRDGGSLYPFVAQNNAAGNASAEFNLTYNVAGTQQMIDAIRGEYAGNVILSASPWWASEIQLWAQSKPTDPHGQLAASWHDYGWTGTNSGHDGPMSVLNAGFPIVITEQWNVNGVGGGYSWLLSQGIGFLWWGDNVWAGQSIASEFSRSSPWSDTADQAAAPNY